MLKFKYPYLPEELEGLRDVEGNRVDPRLKVVLFALSTFAWRQFKKDIYITELLRTQRQQDEYYGNIEAYKTKPWYSVHQFGRGADASIKGAKERNVLPLTEDEVSAIEDFLDRHFLYNGPYKTCIVHDIGQGVHIHIQVDATGKTIIK